MPNRQEKIQEALRIAAAEFLAREANRQSLVTVTRTVVSEDGKHGTIYITVFPDSAEGAAVKFANRHRTEFAEFFKKKVRGAFPPHVEFVIDMGEKNRQRLDELTP
jgi:ribosome-binding factor A